MFVKKAIYIFISKIKDLFKRKVVSIYDICDLSAEKAPEFTDEENILLSAIASLLYYECLKTDRTIKSFIKVLDCIYDKTLLSENKSIFDYLFIDVEEKRPHKHAAVILYKKFKKLSVEQQISIRDSCVAKLISLI